MNARPFRHAAGPLDHWLGEAQGALSTLFASPVARRPDPGAGLPPVELDETQRRHVAGLQQAAGGVGASEPPSRVGSGGASRLVAFEHGFERRARRGGIADQPQLRRAVARGAG